MSTLDEHLDRLATLSPAGLGKEWARMWNAPAPRLSNDLLRFGLAYRLQEKQHGGLDKKVVRELRRIADGGGRDRQTLRSGTQLVRSWQGRTIAVQVTEQGYMFEDRCYRSLSAIAREVTGAHWSGPRFFGTHAGG